MEGGKEDGRERGHEGRQKRGKDMTKGRQEEKDTEGKGKEGARKEERAEGKENWEKRKRGKRK